jgi:hypothetical protein
MANRWAVDLSLWLGSMTPRASGAAAIPLAGFELSGRWRIREPIELGFSLFGGGSGDPNNNDMNTVAVGGFMVDARWRFLYDRPWNIAAVAGLGVMSAAAKAGATDTDKQGRGALRVGAAVERRFEHWAIEADFRIFAIQKNDSVTLLDQPTQRTYDAARYGCTGAYLTIGGSYYF